MLAKIKSAAVVGLDGQMVVVVPKDEKSDLFLEIGFLTCRRV